MYRVIAMYQRPDYKWDKVTTKPFIMKEEADKELEKQAFIAKALLAEKKIIDYQIETIEGVRA